MTARQSADDSNLLQKRRATKDHQRVAKINVEKSHEAEDHLRKDEATRRSKKDFDPCLSIYFLHLPHYTLKCIDLHRPGTRYVRKSKRQWMASAKALEVCARAWWEKRTCISGPMGAAEIQFSDMGGN